MKTKLLLFLLVLIISSCKELEEPISTTGEKVFFLNGKINNTINLNFAGGDSLNYHYTSHRKDEMNVYEFISEFKNESCANCDDQVKITIRAHEQTLGNSINISDVLSKGTYNYLENIVLPRHRNFKFTIDTTKIPIGSSRSLLWEFGDGASSTEISPVHYYKEDGVKKVSLTYSNSSCSSKIIKDVLAVPDSTASNNCKSDFYYTINASQVKFFPVDTALITSYLWDLGDGNTSTLPYPIHNYGSATSYMITLTVRKDFFGCEYTVSRQMNLNFNNCDADFNFRLEAPAPSTDTLNLSKVLIEYTTKDGEYFRSDLIAQSSLFEISELEPYLNNEKNEKTIRFFTRFSCELQSDRNNYITIDNCSGKIAVSYP